MIDLKDAVWFYIHSLFISFMAIPPVRPDEDTLRIAKMVPKEFDMTDMCISLEENGLMENPLRGYMVSRKSQAGTR